MKALVIAPSWFKRWGFWFGLGIVGWGVYLIAAGQSLTSLAADIGFIALGVVLAVDGWLQGVTVTDSGIQVRRIFARRRSALWAEIEHFADERGAVAVLRDGSRMRLADWLCDTRRIVARMEAERQRRV